MIKLIHAADIHLDSPMRGLPDYEGAPIDEIRGATRRALEALVDMAGQEQVGLVLIAGDLFDGRWPDFNTGLFFPKQMARLQSAGARGVIMSLWSVPDDDTRQLMDRFYDAYLMDHDPAAALAQAQRASLSQQRDAGAVNPWYWAGFVVCGGSG